MIPHEKLIVFDVETHGTEREWALQPWRAKGIGADIRMYSFAWFDADKKIKTNLFTTVDRYRLSEQLTYYANQGCFIVGWNVPFDIAWLLAYGLRTEVYSNKWLDGMLLWQRLETNKMRLKEDGWGKDKQVSFGLKAAVKEFLPKFADYEEGIDFTDFSPEMTAKMGIYCRKDTAFTLSITKSILYKLSPKEVANAITEGYALPMVSEAWMEGLHVNVPALLKLNRKVMAETDEARQKLYADDPYLQQVNLGSPKQLAEILFDRWGLQSIKTTDAGARSTDKETLHELALFDPRAELVRKVREGQGNLSKFVEGTKESILYHQEAITRPQPRVYGTYSGRMTYYSKQGKGKGELPTGVPLHQWKRDPDFRRVLVPPPGYALIELDAANQEYRWMAIESGDETMLEMCMPGQDPHSYMGAQIAEVDYQWLCDAVGMKAPGAKDKRQLGKVANLSCIAENQRVLTDRGFIAIQHVTIADLLWDGLEWVSHSGVIFKGVQEVMTYEGIVATPEHRVLTKQGWQEIQKAAQMGWRIESSLGAGWACRYRTTVRIMDGVIRRAVSTVWRSVRDVSLSLWAREGSQFAYDGDGAQYDVQRMCYNRNASSQWQTGCGYAREKATTEACQCHETAMSESPRSVVPKLRGAWHTVQIRLGEIWSGLYLGRATRSVLRWFGYRSNRQQWTLRTGESSIGDTQGKPPKQATYDILNAGPRNRFSVGFSLVHNCQYRTSAKTLLRVARVQYDLPMPLDQAENIHNKYRTTYPKVPEYWSRQIMRARYESEVWTLGGRKLEIRGDWSSRSEEGNMLKWKMESSSINFPIQGVGADQKYLALRLLKDYANRHSARFYMELHDGVFFVAPEKTALDIGVAMQQILNTLPYKDAWGFTPPIPLPWDLKVGPSFGDLKEIK